ncbi:MAG: hypothetical protein A2896_01875 [Candidatus Nealsonbacteria bacterium RIFCSPLOWO2_01_FULL_43_32]|uniref:Uncharacterized protein n=1 Tax=Candidatus Nealsonbacteria bacterium RIFCSPLOWO2_01_FULL_43_32 TaxID=1801672 RepID=A0A1G2EGB3_9BACT|nr:MAG: hypothetical protein A2896_01875 [Candidatus Nealsonbacteria bacterium RIFCSPLOWO2_01_FULL_43_32]
MKIKESKNLKYDKIPKMTDSFEEDNVFEPRFCMLVSFQMTTKGLELSFRNSSRAFIAARNSEGTVELETITQKMKNFIGQSYEEILNADF